MAYNENWGEVKKGSKGREQHTIQFIAEIYLISFADNRIPT
jgi:hypothetical protein